MLTTLARAALLLPLVLAGCRTPALVVASDLANPPFAEVDEGGEPRGRDVDMTAELARRTGRDLQWVRLPFDRLLEAVERGEVDVAVATLGVTPERARRVSFTRTYYATSLVALVRRGDGEPQRLEDLAGRTVAAARGTTSESALRERLPTAVPAEPSDKDASNVERLLLGEVDAIVMDAPYAFDLARERPDVLRVLSTPVAAEDYAIAVRPRARWLVEELDRALAEMAADGTLEALDGRYGL